MVEGANNTDKLYFKFSENGEPREIDPDTSISSIRKMCGPSGYFDDWRLGV